MPWTTTWGALKTGDPAEPALVGEMGLGPCTLMSLPIGCSCHRRGWDGLLREAALPSQAHPGPLRAVSQQHPSVPEGDPGSACWSDWGRVGKGGGTEDGLRKGRRGCGWKPSSPEVRMWAFGPHEVGAIGDRKGELQLCWSSCDRQGRRRKAL